MPLSTIFKLYRGIVVVSFIGGGSRCVLWKLDQMSTTVGFGFRSYEKLYNIFHFANYKLD